MSYFVACGFFQIGGRSISMKSDSKGMSRSLPSLRSSHSWFCCAVCISFWVCYFTCNSLVSCNECVNNGKQLPFGADICISLHRQSLRLWQKFVWWCWTWCRRWRHGNFANLNLPCITFMQSVYSQWGSYSISKYYR